MRMLVCALMCGGMLALAGCATPSWLAYHPHTQIQAQPAPVADAAPSPAPPSSAPAPAPPSPAPASTPPTSAPAPRSAPAPVVTKPPADPPKFIVTPVTTPTGKVVRVNENARFAVLNFPVGTMPGMESRLNVYRHGLKVAEVKVTGPQQDDNTVADIMTGEVQVGDELRVN